MNKKYTTGEVVLYVVTSVVAVVLAVLLYNVVVSALSYKPKVSSVERVVVYDRTYNSSTDV